MFITVSGMVPATLDHLGSLMSIPDPPPPFTALQGQYLAFIYAYTKINGQPPAEADLQRYFRVSAPTVHQMVLALERARLIRRTPRRARSIELLVTVENLPTLS